MEVRDVARGVDVGMTGAAELVDDDAVLHQQPGLLRQLDAGLDAEACHDHVRDELPLRRGAHDALPAPRAEARHPFLCAQLDALRPVVVDE